MKILTRLRRLWRDRRGNALIIAGAGLPLLVGAAGIGVDTFSLSVLKRQLQRAADSGALAGGYALTQSADLNDAVDNDIDINEIRDRLNVNPIIESAPTVGSFAGDPQAVRVRLSADGYSPFIRFFLQKTIVLNVEAVAKIDYSGEYCLVALYGGTDTGIDISGTADMNLGCGMATNSRGDNAIDAGGSSTVAATPLAAMGAIPPSANFQPGVQLQPYSPQQIDPLARVPDQNPCDGSEGAMSVSPSGNETFSAGCYSKMDLKGDVTLNPGTYYVTGDVDFGSQTVVNGTNVTIVMTGPGGDAGDFKLNAGAELHLTAQSSGDYAGVVLYRDRRADVIGVTLNGGADFDILGAFYMPTTNVTMNGNFSMSADCFQMVGYKVSVKGTAQITNSCPDGSGAEAFKGTYVRLVQ